MVLSDRVADIMADGRPRTAADIMARLAPGVAESVLMETLRQMCFDGTLSSAQTKGFTIYAQRGADTYVERKRRARVKTSNVLRVS